MKKQICMNCKKKINQKNLLLCNNCGGIPVPIDMFDSMKEMKKNSVNLNKKIHQLREYVRSLKLHNDDERLNMLQNLSYLFGWLNWQLDFYLNCAKEMDDAIPKKIKNENPEMTDSQMKGIIENFDIINRRTFFVDFMFRIEYFMKRINGLLVNPSKQKRYGELIVHILKELKISKARDEHFRALVFPSYVRNSLHMNGIHTDNDENGTIKGVFFKLKKGDEVTYTSWRHLYFFCDNILNELKIILSSELIKQKPIIILGPIKKFWEILKPGMSMRLPKNFPLFDENGKPI